MWKVRGQAESSGNTCLSLAVTEAQLKVLVALEMHMSCCTPSAGLKCRYPLPFSYVCACMSMYVCTCICSCLCVCVHVCVLHMHGHDPTCTCVDKFGEGLGGSDMLFLYLADMSLKGPRERKIALPSEGEGWFFGYRSVLG